jgi:hypothetical protein
MSRKPPCILCHFCLRAEKVQDVPHGAYCTWFGYRIAQEDVDNKQSRLREKCLQDGDHFIWRSEDADPVALADWRKTTMDQRSFRIYRNVTLVTSLVALALSIWALVRD